MSWRKQAACVQLPWEFRAWFFGEGAEAVPVHEQHERARMVCYLCPVQIDCLNYWYETDEGFGVWGGLTVSQRKRYLMPKIRRSRGDVMEAFYEVLWTMGSKLLPKLEELFREADHQLPALPVDKNLPDEVLLDVLAVASREDPTTEPSEEAYAVEPSEEDYENMTGLSYDTENSCAQSCVYEQSGHTQPVLVGISIPKSPPHSDQV